jgi:hypothetical protein
MGWLAGSNGGKCFRQASPSSLIGGRLGSPECHSRSGTDRCLDDRSMGSRTAAHAPAKPIWAVRDFEPPSTATNRQILRLLPVGEPTQGASKLRRPSRNARSGCPPARARSTENCLSHSTAFFFDALSWPSALLFLPCRGARPIRVAEQRDGQSYR